MLIKICKLNLFILILFSCLQINGQIPCTKYWHEHDNSNKQIDSILLRVPLELLDTIFCDEYNRTTDFNKQWYVDFYNQQFGNYFSDAKDVNFNMFWYKQKHDTIEREINIIQFTLDNTAIEKIKPKLKEKSLYTNFHFIIEALTIYRYFIINNNIYFICTEPRFYNPETDLKFYNIVVETFKLYKE